MPVAPSLWTLPPARLPGRVVAVAAKGPAVRPAAPRHQTRVRPRGFSPVVCALCALAGGVLPAAPATPENPAVARFEKLAGAGDGRAMTALGLIYHQGDGVKPDYTRAYDWYLKAIEKGDGDAVNNLGVLFRDGLGVAQNQKVAYLLFLAVHMEGMGTDDTQIRAGRNLDRLRQSLPQEQLHEALSYTWPYVIQILKSRGKNLDIGPDVLPTKERPRIRDNGWWLDRERAAMTFASPPPWNQGP